MNKIFQILATICLLSGCTVSVPVQKSVQQKGTTMPATSPEKTDKRVIVSAKSKFLDHGSLLRIYVCYEIDKQFDNANLLEQFKANHIMNFTLLPDYASKQALNASMVDLATAQVSKNKNSITVSFEIPKPKDLYTGVVVTNIAEKLGNSLATTFTNDLFVRFQSGKMGDYFGFFDKTGQSPLLNNYVFSQDSLMIKDLQNTNRKMMVLKYSHDFDPAQSPTATMPRSVTRALYLDTLYYVETNKAFKLNDQALYYFCRDTTESYGLGILGVDNRFPRYTRPETMTRPLTYMSTNQEMAEWSKANSTEEAKKAIDRFFLTLTNGNQQVAKRIIKNYYQRIEQANQLFTTYKEGWKTDKGMVYIILGQPDKIQRNKDKEIWSYSRRGQPSDINFTFLRRPNQFIDDHYELTRYPEYQSFWFPVVEAWRIGEMAGN